MDDNNRQIHQRELKLLVQARLKQLAEAWETMMEQTVPHTPCPRIPEFAVGDQHILFPKEHPFRGLGIVHRRDNDRRQSMGIAIDAEIVPRNICADLGYQPAKIYRFLKDVDRVIQWAQNRRAGRLRHAQEILRQQQRYLEELESMAALEELAR